MKKTLFITLLLCMLGTFSWAVIVGRDNRDDWTGKDEDVLKAVVVLFIERADGGYGTCSGSMIGTNVVFTAAHCLSSDGEYHRHISVYAVGLSQKGMEDQTNNMEEEEVRDWSHPENLSETSMRLPLSTADFPSAESVDLWVPQAYLDDATDENDYGLVILKEPLGERTGTLHISIASDLELKNKEVLVIGRGKDKPIASLWEGKGRIGRITPEFIHHNADTREGNSGGPVLDIEQPGRIIALNNYYIEESSDPLVHYYPNGGVRITRKIINDVEKRIEGSN